VEKRRAFYDISVYAIYQDSIASELKNAFGEVNHKWVNCGAKTSTSMQIISFLEQCPVTLLF
jgi:hypothetical protein